MSFVSISFKSSTHTFDFPSPAGADQPQVQTPPKTEPMENPIKAIHVRNSRLIKLLPEYNPTYGLDQITIPVTVDLWGCPFCGGGVDTEEEVVKHVKEKHRIHGVVDCLLCPTFFMSVEALGTHVGIYHVPIKYEDDPWEDDDYDDAFMSVSECYLGNLAEDGRLRHGIDTNGGWDDRRRFKRRDGYTKPQPIMDFYNLVGTLRAGDERVQTAAVRVVEDKTTKELYVIKSGSVQELRAEADILNMPAKSNRIVDKIALHEENARIAHLVLEYCSGGILTNLIDEMHANFRPLPEELVWEVILDIAEAMTFLQTGRVDSKIPASPSWRPIVHIDIKPDNIALGNDGLWKLIDFGISTNVPSSDREYIGLDWHCGTVNFEPPEFPKLFGLGADVWALGCVVHELCAAEPLRDVRGISFEQEKSMTMEQHAMVGIRIHDICNPDRETTNLDRGYDSRSWVGSYSETLQTMMLLMLIEDPEVRPTPEQVFRMTKVHYDMGVRQGTFTKRGYTFKTPETMIETSKGPLELTTLGVEGSIFDRLDSIISEEKFKLDKLMAKPSISWWQCLQETFIGAWNTISTK